MEVHHAPSNSLGHHLIGGLREVFSIRQNIRDIRTLKPLTKFLMLLMLAAELAAFAISPKHLMDWLGLITGVANVLMLVLCDQGRLTNYFWGIIATAVWFLVAIDNWLVGDLFSQGFYFLMQFVGIAFWHRDLSRESRNRNGTAELVARKLTPLMVGVTIAGTVVIYLIVLVVSLHAHGTNPYVDATLLPLGIIGQVLMTSGYRSQWVAWLLLDAINVEVWLVQLANGGAAAITMLVLQVVMLVNAVYGTYLWFRPQHATE